jgi:hypothetical protein
METAKTGAFLSGAEEIVNKLRETDVLLSNGHTLAQTWAI